MIILGEFSPILHENLCCGYSLEALAETVSNEYPQHSYEEVKKYPRIITKLLFNNSMHAGKACFHFDVTDGVVFVF